MSTKRAQALADYLRKHGLGTAIRNVTGHGSAAGAAHTPAEYAGDRRAVTLPI